MRLIVGLATLLLVVCLGTEASAHASLVSAEPRDGSVLAQAPKRVELPPVISPSDEPITSEIAEVTEMAV